jgi:CcmD family protein
MRDLQRIVLAALVLGGAFVAAAPASSQGSEAAAAPSASAAPTGGGYDAERLSQQGFVPAPSGANVEDSVSGGGLMLAAYAALWLLVGGYLYRLASRSRRAESELVLLQQRLDELEARLKRG